ncbi:hypothetical protein, partial [Moorena sp. SIO4G3]|uniref:hypothetical protein n=1 Tax=Moorena sp. SIO4G3 TaxID=2607821 RepID=UPI0025FBA823
SEPSVRLLEAHSDQPDKIEPTVSTTSDGTEGCNRVADATEGNSSAVGLGNGYTNPFQVSSEGAQNLIKLQTQLNMQQQEETSQQARLILGKITPVVSKGQKPAKRVKPRVAQNQDLLASVIQSFERMQEIDLQ